MYVSTVVYGGTPGLCPYKLGGDCDDRGLLTG